MWSLGISVEHGVPVSLYEAWVFLSCKPEHGVPVSSCGAWVFLSYELGFCEPVLLDSLREARVFSV